MLASVFPKTAGCLWLKEGIYCEIPQDLLSPLVLHNNDWNGKRNKKKEKRKSTSIVEGLFEQLWMNVTSSEKKCFTGMGQFNTEQQLTAVTGSKVAASKGRGITARLETASILLLIIERLSSKHIQDTFSFSFIGSVQACSIW